MIRNGKEFTNLTWDDMCDLMCGQPEEDDDDSPSEAEDTEDKKQKPNPIFVPKHIAHRKKRGH